MSSCRCVSEFLGTPLGVTFPRAPRHTVVAATRARAARAEEGLFMTTAVPGLPHLVGLLRSRRGGLAILSAFVLSGLLVIQALAATLSVSTASLPDAAQSTAYNQALTATGGTAPYTWDITEGALPAGLSMTAGVISGTPSVLANSAFTVRVTDGDGNTATKSLAIKVNPQLTVATTALASGVTGVAYTSQTLA